MSLLKVQDLVKSYESRYVLNGLSFELSEGEILAVVGQSGTGKSSLLRIIAGLLDADSGSVHLNELLIKGPKRKLVPGYEEIQLVHQDFELHPYMSIGEAVRKHLSGYESSFQDERTEQLLSLAQLENQQDKYPREISGGQQQKIAIATAIANEPEVLLMDEPFSNLDPFSKARFFSHIRKEIEQLGTGVIFVTHDTRDALLFADRIIVLRDSKMIQEGTPQEIYHEPLDQQVAEFFGPVSYFESSQIDQYVPWTKGNQSGRQVGIRPESIKVCESGLEVEVRQCLFAGERYQIQASVGDTSVLFYHKKHLESGQKVKVSLDSSQILHF